MYRRKLAAGGLEGGGGGGGTLKSDARQLHRSLAGLMYEGSRSSHCCELPDSG